MQKSIFIFDSYTIDIPGKKISFTYTLVHGEETIQFEEQIVFPIPIPSTVSKELIERIAAQLHIALGISYYKLYCPQTIEIRSTQLSKEQATFWNTVYTKGLGEFFYKNSIDFRNLIHFPSEVDTIAPITGIFSERSLVGIGGGKDSLVALELLKEHNKPVTAYVLETKRSYAVIDEVIDIANIDALRITRVVDPKLYEYNKRPDTFNGHVPISSIYALVGILVAAIYDYRYVIASNERSASYGNGEYLGHEINHQWSKSIEFESLLQNMIKNSIITGITYFSLLRPLYEIGIVERFVKYPQYFNHFSSCNRNFSLLNKANTKWCGECPKCAFVFLLLSAYLPKDTVLQLFGVNLFEKESLLQTYKELLGMSGIKPFDCVGTPEESQMAFYLSHTKGEFEDTPVMKYFIQSCLPQINEQDLKRIVLTKYDSPCMPEQFTSMI